MQRPYAPSDVEPASFAHYLGDSGKLCQAPSCNRKFFRRKGETSEEYERRRTCGTRCHYEFQGTVKRANANKRKLQGHDPDEARAWIAADDVTCSNCKWWGEDSELGKHCGPCTGQNFRSKREAG